MLIDNKLALVGTVNMDLRSFLLNFEITVAVEDRNFANEVATLHENYLVELFCTQYARMDQSSFLSSNHRAVIFSCLVHYSNSHNKYKKGVPHTVRPFFFTFMLNVFSR